MKLMVDKMPERPQDCFFALYNMNFDKHICRWHGNGERMDICNPNKCKYLKEVKNDRD